MCKALIFVNTGSNSKTDHPELILGYRIQSIQHAELWCCKR